MASQSKSKTQKGIILLVDDEDTIVEVCSMMLQRLGYTVLEARDGKKAIDIFEKNKDVVNLVLLDLRMPGMNGATVYNHLIEIKPDVKVLLFSGYFENKHIQKILENSNTDLIQKPVRMNQLSEKLQNILG